MSKCRALLDSKKIESIRVKKRKEDSEGSEDSEDSESLK